MKFAQTKDGTKIAYATREEGPLTLLFLHGWSGSGAYFDETLQYLDLAGLLAVTFDLRGHGDSDQPNHGYTDEGIAQDALAVADAVQAEQFVVVGFSMSGRFAQYLSMLAPDACAGKCWWLAALPHRSHFPKKRAAIGWRGPVMQNDSPRSPPCL